MNSNLTQFNVDQLHFIRPEWLWLWPIALLLWLLLKKDRAGQQWSNHISKEMLAALQLNSTQLPNGWKWYLLTGWVAIIAAAAGPTWNKQAVPTLQNKKALVLVLDLSPSMLAQDLTPDRLTLAKYKLIDVLRKQADGQTALIAYAGDAHTVSPLTDDPAIIETLLPALHPNIMPSAGSNTEAAIELAQQLLSDAGLASGDILLITDGVAPEAIAHVNHHLRKSFRLSVLAIGSREATPVPAARGGFLHKANGEIVLSTINRSELRQLATRNGGHFSTLTTNDSDIEKLLSSAFESSDISEGSVSNIVYDAWADMGHWLALLSLPLFALLFRKGLIYLLPLILILPTNSEAAGLGWDDLWQTRDQQATKFLKQKNYNDAANTFKRKDWSAIANYKQGHYEHVITDLEGFNDTTSLYNKANALALKGDLKEALTLYQRVIKDDPKHADAAHNKSLLEQLMKQQEEQQNQQPQDQNSEDSSEGDPSEQKDQNSQEKDSKSQQKSEKTESEKQKDKGQETDDAKNSKPSSQQQSQQQEPSKDSQQQNQQPSELEEQGDDKETESEQANTKETPEENNDNLKSQVTNTQIDSSDKEPLKDSSEQWLRSIQDDPSGLLRRKFEYQTQTRARQRRQSNRDDNQKRY